MSAASSLLESLLIGRRKNILVVDDSIAIRTLLSKVLKEYGFNVRTAANGVEALKQIEDGEVPLVICDWEMPEMDGVEFTQEVRRKHTEEHIYILILTANTAPDAIGIIFDAGADDYLTKPVDVTALGARLLGGLRLVAWADDLRWFNQQLTDRNRSLDLAYERIQQDLIAAESLQKRYLPSKFADVNGVGFGGVFMPAFHTSGDMFNYIRLSDDEIAVFSADVSGHGVASSLLAVTVAEIMSAKGGDRSLLVDESRDGWPVRLPHEVVTDLNARFVNDESDHYFTITYGILHLPSRTFRFCQAGHPEFLIVSADGKGRCVGEGGMPVGMFDGATFTTQVTRLNPGDRVFLFSDGVPECENPETEQFGMQNMIDVLGFHAEEPLDQNIKKLIDCARAWQARDDFADDVSVLSFELPA